MEIAEWEEKRRSHTTPNISLSPSDLGGGRSRGEQGEGEIPELEGHSEDTVRRREPEGVREQSVRHPPHTIIGGEGVRHEVRKAGKKGLMNGAERPKRSPFKKLTGGGKQKKKESFIRSADFDRVERISSSESEDGDDDCFPDEVGGAEESEFRSLLLFIPLRLGQDKFNMEYKEAIKVFYIMDLKMITLVFVLSPRLVCLFPNQLG